MNLKKVMIIMLLLFVFFIIGHKQNNDNLEQIKVVLDWTPNTNHTGLVVAIKNGYYKEQGIDVSLLQPFEDGSLPLVAANKAQFGISSQEVLANALASKYNMPITAVAAIIQHNTSGILSLKNKNIKSFKDLEEKVYATWNDPFEQAVLKQAMENEGADFDKLKLYYDSVTDVISALKTNVDAFWVYEAWDVILAKLNNISYNFIKFKDVEKDLDYYTPILVANKDFLNQNEEIVKKFLYATKKGYEFAIQNPEQATKILVDTYPEINFTHALESQKFLSDKYKDDAKYWGYIDIDRWNNFFDWLYQNKIIDKSLKNIGFTNEYLSKE